MYVAHEQNYIKKYDKDQEEQNISQSTYEVFTESIFFFKQLIEQMFEEEPSVNIRAEIVLPYAFRGILIHLLNPQLSENEEDNQ